MITKVPVHVQVSAEVKNFFMLIYTFLDLLHQFDVQKKHHLLTKTAVTL